MELPEVLPVESPEEESSPVEVTGGLALSDEEFQRRVTVVMAAIEDPEKFRRCVAEIHTYLSMFEQGFRQMQNEMLASGGAMGMFRKMFLGR